VIKMWKKTPNNKERYYNEMLRCEFH